MAAVTTEDIVLKLAINNDEIVPELTTNTKAEDGKKKTVVVDEKTQTIFSTEEQGRNTVNVADKQGDEVGSGAKNEVEVAAVESVGKDGDGKEENDNGEEDINDDNNESKDEDADKHVLRRFCSTTNATNRESEFNSSSETEPLSILNPKEPFKCRARFENIEPGSYNVVWCISRSAGAAHPPKMSFEVKAKSDTSSEVLAAEFRKTEYLVLPVDDEFLLVLRERLWIAPHLANLHIDCSMEIAACASTESTEEQSYIKVHWFEFMPWNNGVDEDYPKGVIVNPINILLDSFNVKQPGRPDDIHISYFEIASGKYAATTSIAGSTGYVDLWELSQNADKKIDEDQAPTVNKAPVGSVSLDLSTIAVDADMELMRLGVAVSPDGSQIVVYQRPKAKNVWDSEYMAKKTKVYDAAEEKRDKSKPSIFQGMVFKYDTTFTPAEMATIKTTSNKAMPLAGQGKLPSETEHQGHKDISQKQQASRLLVNRCPAMKSIMGFEGYGKFHKLPIVNKSIAIEKKKAREIAVSDQKDKISGGNPEAPDVTLSADGKELSLVNTAKSRIVVVDEGDVHTSIDGAIKVERDQSEAIEISTTLVSQQVTSARAIDVEISQNEEHTDAVAIEEDDSNDEDNTQLVFLACDGINVTAYDAEGDWQILYSVSLKGLSNNYNERCNDAMNLIETFKGLYFLWDHGSQVISFWNIMNGLNVSYIAWGTSKDTPTATEFAMSEDASIVVIATDKALMSYYTESGLAISTVSLEYSEPLFLSPNPENGSLSILTYHTFTLNVHHHVRDMATLLPITDAKARTFKFDSCWCQDLRNMFDIEGQHLERHEIIPKECLTTEYRNDELYYTRTQLGMWGEDRKTTLHPPEVNWSYRLHTVFRRINKADFENSLVCLTLYKESAEGSIIVLEFIPEPFILFSPNTDVAIHKMFEAAFLPCGTRFVIFACRTVQIWALPNNATLTCTLQSVISRPFPHYRIYTARSIEEYYLEGIYDMFVAKDMTTMKVAWLARDEDEPDTVICEEIVVIPVVGLFDSRLAKYCIDSIPALISMHSAANVSTQKIIIRYVRQFIMYQGPKKSPDSVMERVVSCCKLQGFKEFLIQLLSDDPGHTSWVPRYSHIKDSWEGHISFMLSHAKLEYAKILIDYCIRQSKIRDAMFVEPVMACFPVLMSLYPDLALQISNRTSYTPVSKILTKFVETNALHPKVDCPLYAIYHGEDILPRLQSRLMEKPPKVVTASEAYDFEGQLYLAPFSLIWTMSSDNPVLSPTVVERVVAHRFSLEYFDNPALASLLQFKWNQLGLMIWIFYFLVRALFYGLVLKVTFNEIYDGDLAISTLKPYLIAVVVFAFCMFLTEVQQMRGSIVRHFSSPYNWFDMLVCVVPFSTSVQSLVYMVQDPDQLISVHASRLVSFSILIVYIQIIFELRVFKEFCNNATIILSIMWRIGIFFGILAISIVGFAHGFLHLIHTHYAAHCMNLDPDNPDLTCEDINGPLFPMHFGSALSTTYFFLAGRYDAVTAEMDQRDWAFHIMLAMFFFVTTVLMMNVLIALMNSVYADRESAGALIWRQNRLRDVETSQNIMYRNSEIFKNRKFDFNPKQIYFVASEIEVTEHREKHLRMFMNDYRPFMTEKVSPTFGIRTGNNSQPAEASGGGSGAVPGLPPVTAAPPTLNDKKNLVVQKFVSKLLDKSGTNARSRQQQHHNNSGTANLSIVPAPSMRDTRPSSPTPGSLAATNSAINPQHQKHDDTEMQHLQVESHSNNTIDISKVVAALAPKITTATSTKSGHDQQQMQQDISVIKQQMKEMQDMISGMHAIILQQNSNQASKA